MDQKIIDARRVREQFDPVNGSGGQWWPEVVGNDVSDHA